ncbi:MAG: monofunctional biosynthetic peptidoglycan transglycosylase [Caldithrix sp.]|nr:monofunctional biosynthetic peptidoglycan transglycosylase [Caldithrix sp.]
MSINYDDLIQKHHRSVRPWQLFKEILFLCMMLFIGYAVFIYASLPDVSNLQRVNPDTTALMQLRLDQAARTGQNIRIRQQWVSFNTIPKLLKQAVRVSEDGAFYLHEGVDFNELKEAIKENWQEKTVVRGASTITQQLAKNLYLTTDRSLTRKLKEYFITRRLEKHLSKNRIFHIYLNIIEFGPGVFGVQAASRHFFNKPVQYLNMAEIMRLAAVIPKPLRVKANGDSGWLKWKCRWILRTLQRYGYIDEKQYRLTLVNFE